MPRSNAKKKKKCNYCEKTFTNAQRLKCHLRRCAAVLNTKELICERCATSWPDAISFNTHIECCELTCKHGCREEGFTRKKFAAVHEEKHCRKAKAGLRESSAPWIIPRNPYSVKGNDLMTVHDENLPEGKQNSIAASDVAIDCVLGELTNDFNVKSYRVSETRVFELPECKEWAPAKEERTDISGAEFLFLPTTLSPFHWCLLYYDTILQTWFVVDSIREPTTIMMTRAQAIIDGFVSFYSMEPAMSTKLEPFPNECHFQGDNNMNCGIFCCYFATQICKREEFDPAVDILGFRRDMKNTIIKSVGGYKTEVPVPVKTDHPQARTSAEAISPAGAGQVWKRKAADVKEVKSSSERSRRFYECWQ